MKKKTLLLGMAILLSIAACIKEKKSVVPQTDDDDHTVNDTPIIVQPEDTGGVKADTPIVAYNGITITGLKTEINDIDNFGTTVFDLNVKCDSCNGEELFLSVEDLNDPRLLVVFTKESGYSDFNTKLVIKSYFPERQAYHIKISVSDRKGKKTTYKVNIRTTKPTQPNCDKYFSNATSGMNFNEVRYMSIYKQGVGTTNIDTITNTTTRLDEILLGWNTPYNGFYRSYKATTNNHLFTDFNCYTGELNIPEQVLEGKIGSEKNYFTVIGSGNMNLDNMTYEIIYTSRYKDGSTYIVETFKLIAKIP